MKPVLPLIFTAVLSFPVQSAETLSDEFIAATDRIKLYMAYAEFKMGHHQTARQMWQAIGGQERAEALFNLAILTEQGLGQPKDMDKAVQLYRESAESGSRSGAYQLGLIYLNHPDYQNEDEARRWLTQAAEEGDRDAANLLGGLEGEQIDPMVVIDGLLAAGQQHAALKRLQQLAQLKPANPRALTQLAWLYEAGVAIEADLEIAADLFEQAADLGDPEAQYALAVMYETGKGRAQNSELASRWLQRSAELGFPQAKQKLGR